MKKLKVTLTYLVLNWNFCNCDGFFPDGYNCRFCLTSKHGNRCLLYDTSLAQKGENIYKCKKCIEATAKRGADIAPDEQTAATPTISPKDLIKQTIKLYEQYVNELLKQGYPRAMAENAAKKMLLDN